MSTPVLPIVVGTRSELLAAASTVEAFRAVDSPSSPLVPRLLCTGQEATELDQTFESLGIEPDVALDLKAPHVADAALGARLLQAMEGTLRHQNPAAVLAVGSSATAWATGVAAYFKRIPLIHLGAGDFAPESERPWPEWLHRHELARLAHLHLCRDEVCARAIEDGAAGSLAHRATTIRVVGEGADEILARSLASPPDDDDPTLAGLRPGAPRVLVFIRRREHHANALRPLCQALEILSDEFAEHEFIVVHSLQSHICDALVALVPKRPNVRAISPLPHPAFAREVARARLVATDSSGLAREAALLGRPVVTIGSYSTTESLQTLFRERAIPNRTCDMGIDPIREAVTQLLAGADPPSAAGSIGSVPRAGEESVEAILCWWRKSGSRE
ncbi:UDP-N-acetylglucosamine 2-epimerase [Candidatus Sumerlaeota bacterium]|nr:UDP-N-acetylglucosamine 2-epimerase [Candidatus Sumerlaeota bacterium]